ncbi:hypothetical protein AJ85_11420 [Alkalihalobacillus alcalophilus ATCC 27647 = CGMCC 1.3604]|uniref:Uncharacterized protein n=1 Tax=Alkalihalobacillus alcalophilus ATCC 27647 = CGMCC 1.3604 TaxID=1218173 RepID=A0A094WS98_ALKAL|nr:hypothetical protein BALCAV_0201375 [Alkalihalobacillus alcalophilus ATCC 27647 = CGMCC 1.3604]THG90330.1 hypothetical protein AJ85_11420 [Alkalihalobacillus alcalophilus ATCC 27647 = CGMCC 1.3604]
MDFGASFFLLGLYLWGMKEAVLPNLEFITKTLAVSGFYYELLIIRTEIGEIAEIHYQSSLNSTPRPSEIIYFFWLEAKLIGKRMYI